MKSRDRRAPHRPRLLTGYWHCPLADSSASLFTRSPASRQAGQESLRRMYARTEDRDTATTWQTRGAQYDAVCTWGIPDHALWSG
jgi:hypothetical protein